MPKTYFEYRGVSNAVYAEVLADTAEAFTTGTVKDFTGVSEISRSTESSSETHYYDNLPAIVIDAVGADTLTINSSGIPLDILAEITGQYYDDTKGLFVEQEGTPKYYAFGYVTQKTDGTEVLVWRLKGKFTIPDTTSVTKDDGTDASGQELTYTGISTTHKFVATGKPAKAVNIDTSVNQTMTESAFFTSVQTPDSISIVNPSEEYTLTKTQGASTTLSVKRNGVELENNATIASGDALVITVTGGTVTVNTAPFTSGGVFYVNSDTAVVSTAG